MPGRGNAQADGSDRPGHREQDSRSIGDVLASLVVNIQALVAKEIELLGLELKRLVVRKVTAIALLLVAALTAGGVLLLGAMTAALALEGQFADRWVAWGIVTLATAALALLLLLIAVGLLARGWSPRSGRKDPTTTREWVRGLVDEVTGSGDDGEAGR
jgi:hypothetical protein